MRGRSEGRVAELFAGVGGFRLGLEGHPESGQTPSSWRVVWSNQWEPGSKKQHASDCYVARFGAKGHSNEDIAKVLDAIESGEARRPRVDLVVGGFPCQDYSVARVLSQAAGIEGKKGVLWWEIHRFLKLTKPRVVLLENVDRLLKSPVDQRGRDFGVILRCLADLGYMVEWRVVNAADYGLPQRRRRTFIIAERVARKRPPFSDAYEWITRDGVLAQALPVVRDDPARAQLLFGGSLGNAPNYTLPADLVETSRTFRATFENAGVMHRGHIWTVRVRSAYSGRRVVLRDVLLPEDQVPEDYFIPKTKLKAWRYLKGAKREERSVARSGFRYFYTEGAVAFPEPLDEPARTILTGEGGPSPSRFKLVVQTPSGRLRRLTPVELERLNGFPDDWTAGLPATRRAFVMGNALVVGVVERIGRELAHRRLASTAAEQRLAAAP